MNYFLAKTEPSTYSIHSLQKDGETVWDGVHSYAALKAIKAWKPGDLVYVYHSGGESKIVGLMEVVGEPYKDPHDDRGISWVAKVRFKSIFPLEKQVTLKEIKESGLFVDFALVKQSRLSTMPCPQNFVEWFEKR